MKYLVLLCFSFMAQMAQAEATTAAAEEEQIVERAECSLGEDIRRLEVQTSGAGCVLHYAKAGKVEVIASYKHGVEPCRDTLKKVRGNLEGAGCDFGPRAGE
jgi:hypothetical protein